MKVILTQDVKSLGKKDDLVNVSDGYAKNFLFKKNLAVEANADNLNIMKSKKSAEKAREEKNIEQAKELAATLEKTEVVIKTKAGDGGKLFGSVTNKDVADELKKSHNIDVDKKKIQLESVKSVGTYVADIKLYTGVSAKVNVKIEGID